nr:YdcF family protein [uncultured Mucilaginibacter sp.]
MYFILSKILFFLLVPLNWVLVLFTIAVFKRDKAKRRRYIIAGLSLLYLFTTPLLLKGFTRLWDIRSEVTKTNTTKYSCVIVLGGFSGSDGQGGGRFNGLADRFINGAQMITTGKAKRILIAGGNGSLLSETFREATWARGELKKLRIADSLILTESNSRNTIENAEFSKKILEVNNLKPPYLLVTSAFHMRRAVMIFKKRGMDVVPYSSSYLTNNSQLKFTDLFPQADILSHWELYFKEVVGYVINYFSA